MFNSVALAIIRFAREQRTLMRSAVQRITDITNSLHNKRQIASKVTEEKIESVMISSLVDSLVSEKRVQVRDRKDIHIEANLEKSYGLFSRVNPIELKRVISNLINNSIESFDGSSHHIYVTLERVNNMIEIRIEDDGKGIPKEIIDRIGQQGFSFGKELIPNSGTGLGISHAIKALELFNGSFAIQSELNRGTVVTLKLPQYEVPAWFIEKIELKHVDGVIVLDDDQSIYDLWREKFSRYSRKLDLQHFSSGELFRNFYLQRNEDFSQKLFLFDYELLNQQVTGLDLIEQLSLARQAVLVTSYYDDPVIVKKCRAIGLRIIPKSIVPFVPMG